MRPTALVPLRIEPVPKRRLAHVLSPAERELLVRELFDHVVDVLIAVGLPVITLAPHPVDRNDVEVWRDEGPGLNAALAAATARIGCPVLIVHADLPRLGADDVSAILASPADVVIARANDKGTNAMLLRRLIGPSFGPDSALRHASIARASGLRTHVIDRSGLAFDVDDEAALTSFRASSPRPTP